jgi:pyridoxine/pyridoxamine 5'-phosphate oxidase
MSAALNEKARAILEGTNFATVATIEPDGRPQLSPVWVTHDGDDILFSTTVGRRKHVNISRDPRVTVCVSSSTRSPRSTATSTSTRGTPRTPSASWCASRPTRSSAPDRRRRTGLPARATPLRFTL